MSSQDVSREPPRFNARKLLPVAIAAVGAAALFFFGRDYLSFESLQQNHEALTAWRDQNYVLAALVFVGVYALATALSFPGGLALTLTGGFLFGWFWGGAFAVIGATIGALAIFLVVKAGLGDALTERAGPFVRRAEAGFRENEASYLLIMRLVPAIPFFAANLVPAFLGARTWTYAWTTFLGIIPGGMVYASVGAGLGAVFARGETPSFGQIFEPQILGPLLGLAALAALPIVVKAIRGK
ncbi:MAG: TVP38/TMEM64 family protein [Pseudomonadota bacterium]